jgi:1,4-dihydroxy-2-naphthoate octaprenyltransferase
MGKFGYLMGYILGTILIYGLYLFAMAAFIYDIWNRELPVMPVVLLIVISCWRKIIQIHTALGIDAQISKMRSMILSQLLVDSNKTVNNSTGNKFGGPN